jgi:cytochrome c-type biogenesis protein CcmE
MQNSTIAKIALTGAVIVGGVVFFAKSASSSREPYRMVDQLVTTMAGPDAAAQWNGKQLKVHGWVVAGTIKEKVVDQETIRTFVLHKDGKKIRVFNRGPKPDTFKDQSECVATGRILPASEAAAMAKALDVRADGEQTFVVEATELMAKCPSKYEGAQGNKNLDDSSSVKFQ